MWATQIKLNIPFEVFKKFVEFCKINNFKDDLKIFKVKTNDLKKALIGEERNYEFISQYKGWEGKPSATQTPTS